jgi:hypothetical protein
MRQNPTNIEEREDDLQALQLDFAEACAVLRLPASTLELEIARGKGPLFFKVGRRRFTTPALLREWQAERIAEARAQRGQEVA